MARFLPSVENASCATHLWGIPRKVVLKIVGSFAKVVTSTLNRTRVYNMDTLLDLVQSRPPGTPLLTVSNHMSTLDDPLMWGLKGFPCTDPKLSRWTLAAEDICFTNPLFSYFFRLGKCLPVRRGAGIYQPYMNEALDVLNGGDWLHTFPEGKLCQKEAPLKRLKWGVASLIARASVQPIVLPIAHNGFEKVIPENFWCGKRTPVPLLMKHISIVVGEPFVFDVVQLRLTAKAISAAGTSTSTSSTCIGSWVPNLNAEYQRSGSRLQLSHERFGEQRNAALDETAMTWMYARMSEDIRRALQDLALKAKCINTIYNL